MGIRNIVAGILAVPAMFAMPLLALSGTILHFFSALVAYGLWGPGIGGMFAAGAVFCFPVIGEVAVFIGAWNESGNVINGYSFWVLMWLRFVAIVASIMFLAARLIDR